MADDLLSLTTTINRRNIRIDGKAYALRHLSEVSLMERHRLASYGKLMQALADIGNDQATADIEKATEAIRDAFLRVVIDGDAIVDKLSDEQRLTVLNCFFGQEPLITPKTVTTSETSKPRRGSRVSMAAGRKTG